MADEPQIAPSAHCPCLICTASFEIVILYQNKITGTGEDNAKGGEACRHAADWPRAAFGWLFFLGSGDVICNIVE